MRGGRGRGRGGERVGDLAGLSVGVEDDGEGRVAGGDDHIAALESVMHGEAHGSPPVSVWGDTWRSGVSWRGRICTCTHRYYY